MPIAASVKQNDKWIAGARRLRRVAGKAQRLQRGGIELDAQFFPDFPEQRGFWRFSGFDFASREFPKSAVHSAKASALQQNSAVAGQKRRRNNHHECRVFFHSINPTLRILKHGVRKPMQDRQISRPIGRLMPVKTFLKQLLNDQAATTAIEYGLIITLIGLALIPIGGGMGDAYQFIWNFVSTGVSTAS
jgi:Flp pilus assembly pilin Flp